MSKLLPFPYKLIVLRREHPDWDLAHITVLDCAENPIPGGDIGMSLIQLTQCCSNSLKLTETIIEDINAAPELEDTGCKYCLIRLETSARLGVMTRNSMDSLCLVLKLANAGAAFKAALAEEERPKLPTGSIFPAPSLSPQAGLDLMREVEMLSDRMPSPLPPSAGFQSFFEGEREQKVQEHINPSGIMNDYLL
ncbi:hypothetical protein ABW21_db0202085 [Orbilia brochopaga]|nr:hypothetical protein ABW21_db0202085 [Drechslerella brochopaga]